MDYVCEEIVIDILTRLPVKSLVRFMAVCKLWKSIITSPQFRLELSKRPAKLLVHTDQEFNLVEDDEDENLVRFETTHFPFKHLLRTAKVVGSDNGLVCFCIYTPSWTGIPGTFIIWNPSIRRHAVIPMNRVGEKPNLFYADGFGATISGSDYKYVRIVPLISYGQFNVKIRELVVEIYSWKIGTWRRIHLDMDLYKCKQILHRCVSLRGRLHWMAFDESSFNINSIHSIELEDEVFEDIMLPECVSTKRSCIYHTNIFVIKESLAMIVNEEEWPNRISQSSVWVMQEYGDVNSWSKLCRFDVRTMIDVFDRALHIKEDDVCRKPNSMVHLLKNGEFLLGLEIMTGLKLFPPKLVKYNPKTRKTTNIGGVSSSNLLGFTNYYKESLVFLTDDHRVLADHKVLSGPARLRGV